MSEQPNVVTDGGQGGTDTAEQQEVVVVPFTDDEGKEDSAVFEVTKPIMLVQLQDEIEAKVGESVMVSSSQRDPDSEPSESNPLFLVVAPESLDGRSVRGVINSHIPNRDYGLSADAKENKSLVEKINAGQTLSPEEVTQALRMLIQGQQPA